MQQRRHHTMANMQTTVPSTQPEVSSWAQGVAVFAAVIMMVGGAFQAIEAFAAIVNDEYLVVLPNYVFASMSRSGGGSTCSLAWGWSPWASSCSGERTGHASQEWLWLPRLPSSTSSGCLTHRGGRSSSSRLTSS